MLIKKSISAYTGLLLSAALWAMTFNYQDWVCTNNWQKLQQAISQFEAQPTSLPPFGLWESLASNDFRLKNQLLSLYLELGAQERAALFAATMIDEMKSQSEGEQLTFLQNCVWLHHAPSLQVFATTKLRAYESENPVWMFHQYMLYQKGIVEIAPLSEYEQDILAHYLTEIGEIALAKQINSSS